MLRLSLQHTESPPVSGKVVVRESLRKEGVKIARSDLSLSPFPYEAFGESRLNRVKVAGSQCRDVHPAQMRWDVDHAVKGRTVHERLRSGGSLHQ